MAHVKSQIRAMVVQTLRGATAAGTRVFNSRTGGFPDDLSINVLTLSTEVEGEQAMEEIQDRITIVSIELRILKAEPALIAAEDVQSPTALALDDLQTEVEALLAPLEYGQDIGLQQWEFQGDDWEGSDEAESPIALVTLLYNAHYRVALDNPQVFVS